ncbi:MAG: sugar ABC transporter ATP-binding protein [Chloroflexota bacterium]|nr:MAG: sugar ABC transporter ATP-binding protein [Chloroflexota bacterium]
MVERQPIVEMRGIHKSFGAVRALQGVDLLLDDNEVLGLVGDNAAGKSTLMKVLSGAYLPDKGDILVNNKVVDIKTPQDSRNLGIEMVYQDYMLADNLDVTSNVFLGHEAVRWKFGPIQILNKTSMDRETRALLDRLKIDISSVRLKVENLSGGQRQTVAIGRATAFEARVIIMDEPTAALSVAAIDKVLDLIKQLKEEGASIIIISHRLEDIYRVGDRVVIMRHGRMVGDRKVEGDIHSFREELVAYMVGARDDFSRIEESEED